MEIGYYIITST